MVKVRYILIYRINFYFHDQSTSFFNIPGPDPHSVAPFDFSCMRGVSPKHLKFPYYMLEIMCEIPYAY